MFEVVWIQAALDDLAAIWTTGDSALRQRVTVATHQLDQALASNPNEEGESRDAGDRVCFIDPLGIEFEIDEERSRVFVLHVWQVRRRYGS